MFKTKEVITIIISILVLVFTINLSLILINNTDNKIFYLSIIFLTIIIFSNVIVKKLTAKHYESEAEIKIWELQRFGFKKNKYFKKPVPLGIILPFIISILSYGKLIWLAALEFDIKVLPSRASKRHGKYRFSEMNEVHLGFIAASGVVANLVLAIIGYLINLPDFSRLNIYYSAFSLIPLSNLDGSKIFFGNKTMWFTLSIITIIFLLYSFFLK